VKPVRLSPRERRVFERLLADASAGDALADPAESAVIFERILGAADREARLGFRLLLFAFEWTPFVFGGLRFLFRRYSGMPAEARLEYIERIRSSSFHLARMMMKAIGGTVLISHYGRPNVQRSVGYDAPHLGTRYAGLAANPPEAEQPAEVK
jgi:hypothetical protein